jgi:hypothetical protein
VTTRARTLRLPLDQAQELEAIAGVDEVSVNEEIRCAIAAPERGLLDARVKLSEGDFRDWIADRCG